jgi:hypothetical protein
VYVIGAVSFCAGQKVDLHGLRINFRRTLSRNTVCAIDLNGSIASLQ